MLLEDYLKHTNETHQDYADLKTAVSMICAVADHLNAYMKDIESRNHVLRIQELMPSNLNLRLPHRRFVKEGKLQDQNGNEIFVHLFNDMAIVSKPKSNATAFDMKNKFEFVNAELYDFVGPQHFQIKVKIDKNAWIFRFATEKEKLEWANAMHTIIESNAQKGMQIVFCGHIAI